MVNHSLIGLTPRFVLVMVDTILPASFILQFIQVLISVF